MRFLSLPIKKIQKNKNTWQKNKEKIEEEKISLKIL